MGQIKKTCLAALLVCQLTGMSSGQVSDQQAKSIAEAATRAGVVESKSDHLRLLRREDLEDNLFQFQLTIEGKIRKAAYFFEVTNVGYFIVSPDQAIYASSEDGQQVRLVAVAAATGEPYLLYGFTSPALEFNRLVKDARLRIGAGDDARSHARFCYVATSDPRAQRLIFAPRQLKHEVEDYFFYHYPEKRAEILYRKWWNGFSSRKLKIPYELSASEGPAGYEIKMATVIGSPDRTPLLEVRNWRISSEGLCQLNSVRTIYPERVRR